MDKATELREDIDRLTNEIGVLNRRIGFLDGILTLRKRELEMRESDGLVDLTELREFYLQG